MLLILIQLDVRWDPQQKLDTHSFRVLSGEIKVMLNRFWWLWIGPHGSSLC